MDELLVAVFMALPMDRVQQRFVVLKTSFLLLFTLVEGVLLEVFKASPRDRAQQRLVVQTTSFLLLFTLVEVLVVVLGEVFKALPRDQVQQPFVEQITLTLRYTVVVEVLGEVVQASPKDRAHQRFVKQNMSTLLFLMVVLGREVFAVFTEDSFPQRLPVSRPSFLLVEVFMKVFKVEDRLEVLRTRLRIARTRRLWLKRRGRSKLGFRSGWSRAILVLGLWLLIRKAKLTSGTAVRGGSAGPSLLVLHARDPWRLQCYFYVRLYWFGFVFPGPFCSHHGLYARGGQLCCIFW